MDYIVRGKEKRRAGKVHTNLGKRKKGGNDNWLASILADKGKQVSCRSGRLGDRPVGVIHLGRHSLARPTSTADQAPLDQDTESSSICSAKTEQSGRQKAIFPHGKKSKPTARLTWCTDKRLRDQTGVPENPATVSKREGGKGRIDPAKDMGKGKEKRKKIMYR